MRWPLLVLIVVGIALGDGGMVVPPDEIVEEYGQVAIIKHFGGTEELSIATRFYATSGFAWILPLPSRPSVDSFSRLLLDDLQEHCRPLYRGGPSGFACGFAAVEGPGYGEGGRGVEELEGGVIGSWEWTLIHATEPETLTSYLDSLGYLLPTGVTEAFDYYIEKGWVWFVVARVREGAYEYDDGAVGIRLTFESDSAVFPLYISRISSVDAPVTLYVLAEHRQMFDGAKLKFSGRVDEGTFPNQPGFVAGESHLTKLYRFYSRESMADICLRQAPGDEEFRAIEYYGYRDAGLPLFMVAGMFWLALRRRRRRANSQRQP